MAKLPHYLQKELEEITNDNKLVEDHFYQYVKFGTGGMRGVIGVGTNRMNIYTVRRAAWVLHSMYVKAAKKRKQEVW